MSSARDQRLQLHQDRSCAFNGGNNDTSGSIFRTFSQKQLRRIRNFAQAGILHFKNTDLIG